MSRRNTTVPGISSGDQPPVAIIIVNWNGADDTIACLESLRTLAYSPFSVIVCDNASTDDSWTRICEWAQRATAATDGSAFPQSLAIGVPSASPEAPAQLTLLQTGANLGFAGANNRGLNVALARDAQYMWLLNADTVVTPAALSALVSHCEEDRRIGMCGSTLVYNRDRTTVQAHGGARLSPWRAEGMQLGHGSVVSTPVDRDAIEAQMDYVAGASMLVSASFVRSIGLMEERYFLYFEELDWAVRAQGQFRLGFAPDSIVYHKEGGSIGTSSTAGHSPFSLYYLSRNSLRFYRSYYPARLPVLAAYLVARAITLRLSGSKAHSFAIARALAGRPYRPTKP